jgi:lipopolysaccharide export system permease protein
MQTCFDFGAEKLSIFKASCWFIIPIYSKFLLFAKGGALVMPALFSHPALHAHKVQRVNVVFQRGSVKFGLYAVAGIWQNAFMDRIARYSFFQFLKTSTGFVALLAFLGWMVQLLRSIDLVTAKGQDLLTMVSQSLLVVPEIISIILFLCVALGISRSLSALQTSKEIFPIHSARGPRPLFLGFVAFIILAICIDVTLQHQLVPKANQLAAKRSDEINADLVANSSRPGRFTEVSPRLTMMIEARDRDGTGRGFFLHDERDAERSQTIVAEQSQLAKSGELLFIRLTNGAIQYYTHETGALSTLEFNTYQVSVRELSQSNLFAAVEPTTLELIALAANGVNPSRTANIVNTRLSASLYIVGLGLFAFALSYAPSGRRKKSKIGPEVIILGLGVTMKVLGTAAQQLVGSSGTDLTLYYLIPLIPVPIALLFFFRGGQFSRIPKQLRGAT